MKKIFILLYLILFSNLLSAKVLISPLDAMQEEYGKNSTIVKKNVLLSKTVFQKIQKEARIRLNTKIYRIFTAKDREKILGYGVLVNRKVRSKNAVILYFISNNKLTNIEIIAFNEPLEYVPSKTWQSQFQDIETSRMLKLSREIPTITGATLSARSVTDASRIAFAIYNQLLKEK